MGTLEKKSHLITRPYIKTHHIKVFLGPKPKPIHYLS